MDLHLYTAAEVGDWEVIRQYGSQLYSNRTPNKDTALHILAQFCNSSSTAQQILTTNPKLLSTLNAERQTSLHLAAREGHSNVVRALLDCAKQSDLLKSLLRSVDKCGNLALHEAAKGNHQDIVELFIQEDPVLMYLKNKEKRSPLYVAIQKGHHRVAEAMLSHYKKELDDGVGKISFLFSLGFRYLHDFGNIGIGPDGKTVLHAAATANLPAFLIRIVCEKLPQLIEKIDDLGCTALHYAARLNHQEVTRELLLAGKSMAYVKSSKYHHLFFRILSQSYEYFPETALHVAVIHGQKQVIAEILSVCPDCWQIFTAKNKNIIHLAVEYEQQEVLDFMLEKSWASIVINQKDRDGNTPLHLYAATRNLAGYNLLNHPKVDRNATNSQGLTPLDSLLYPRSGTNLTEDRQALIKAELEGIGAATSSVHIQRRKEVGKRSRETYLVVAALLVTVTFTAAFQPPGGYNSGNGKPVLLESGRFMLFLAFDMIALFLSVMAVISLLLLPDTYTPLVWFSGQLLMVYALFCMILSFLLGVSSMALANTVSALIVFPILCIYFYVVFTGRLEGVFLRIISKKGVK